MLFLALTETWLRDHLDAELNIDGYTIYRSDRTGRKKKRGRNSGGVALYIRNDIAASASVILKTSDGSNEALGVHIKKLNLVVFVIYRPPSPQPGQACSPQSQFSQLLSNIKSILDPMLASNNSMPDIIITGDFNLPKSNWPQCTPKPGATVQEKEILAQLLELSSQFFLQQIVDKPTHRCGNTLDLLFTNNPSLILNHTAAPTSPISSHYIVQLTTTINCESHLDEDAYVDSSPFDMHNIFSPATNWTGIKSMLNNQNWQDLFQDLSTTEMMSLLIEVCEKAVAKFSPKKKQKHSKKSHVPRHRRVLMRKRKKLHDHLAEAVTETRKSALKEKLVQIETELQRSYRSQEEYDESKAIESIKKNSKFFYSYARSKLKTRSEIGPLYDGSGGVTANSEKMSNLFADQFDSAFSQPRNIELDFSNVPPATISDFEFSPLHISEAINEISAHSAAGPDRFPAFFLRECKEELALPLFIIWRRSLDTGEIPDLSKMSVITPIYKGDDKQLPKNYRPVALTSHLIKTFEKLIRAALLSFIESHNLFNPNQHGFRAGRSCLSQLIQHCDLVTKHMESRKNVDVIYLDFAKAFDKLDFFVTLQKLINLGIIGKLFNWIKSFLTGRKQIVSVNGVKSSSRNVVSGVPQGSVLGPLLFLILLGDIDNRVSHASVSSFADDTRILAPIMSNEDVDSLQADLDVIYEWSVENNAQFNDDKFECVRYGYNEQIKSSTRYSSISGTNIKVKSNVRDLGVTVSNTAVFTEHISKTATTTSLKCGWILRTFRSRSPLVMLTLWKSLVLPHLDYCCQLWSPWKTGDIQKIENVQVCFINKIAGMSTMNYWQQLAALKLYSLERRRERYIAIYVWKVIENIVPNFGIKVKTNARRGRDCEVPKIMASAPVRVQNIRFGSLIINGPRIFNSLPLNVRNITGCSVDSFKRALDNYLQTIPDKPRIKNLIPFCTHSSNSVIVMKNYINVL